MLGYLFTYRVSGPGINKLFSLLSLLVALQYAISYSYQIPSQARNMNSSSSVILSVSMSGMAVIICSARGREVFSL